MKPTLMSKEVMTTGTIATTILPDAKQWNTALTGAFSYFAVGKNLITSSVSSPHTPFDTHLQTPMLDSFIKAVEGVVQQYLKDNGYAPLPMKIGESWIVQYQKGDTASHHTHFPFSIGVTYYFNVEDRTPILFYDSTLDRPIPVHPTDGLLCIFPAHIPHSVPVCNGKRGCFASNWAVDIDRI
jgi:hypothetical protein